MNHENRSSRCLAVRSQWLLLLALSVALVGIACSENEPSDEVAALRAELDELRGSLAQSPTPAVTETPTAIPTATETGIEDVRCEFEDGAALVADATVLVLTRFSHGTAFHVGDGEFVTAAHVVEGYVSVTLALASGDTSAVVVGVDRHQDIALLATSGTSSLPALRWADTATIRRGMTVGAAGFPVFAGGDVAVKRGSVSRTVVSSSTTLVETDTPLSPGNSGGPLFDSCGDVLGVVSLKWVESGVEGVAWAVAEPTVSEALASIRSAAESPRSPGQSVIETIDPFEFCRLVDTAHFPEVYEGNARYVGPDPAFRGDGGFLIVWRCWAGIVLGCSPGASGHPCLIVDESGVPSDWLREHCASFPNDPSPPLGAVGHSNAFEWVCEGGQPRITGRVIPPEQIDAFGFLYGPWFEITP